MKKISYLEAVKKFEEQGRKDIVLLEEGYVSWKQAALFYDNVAGEQFKSVPKRVYDTGVCHPKRSMERRKQTNLSRYGNACSVQGGEAKEKARITWEKKYGAEHPWKSPEVRTKIKNTMVERYGVENASSLETVKEKKRETTMKNYGVPHHSQRAEVRDKAKQTCLETYGTEHPSQNSEVKQKIKETLAERYGVNSPFQLPGVVEKARETCVRKYGVESYAEYSKRVVEDTGEYLLDWWKNLPEPKPLYSYLFSYCRSNKHTEFTTTILSEILEAVSYTHLTLPTILRV